MSTSDRGKVERPVFAFHCVLIAVYGIWLVHAGTRKTPGFASWHMFSETCRTYFDLRNGNAPINPWNYLPHSGVQIGLQQAAFFVSYLAEHHGIEVDGTIEVSEPGGTHTLTVAAGRITRTERKASSQCGC